MFHNHLPFKITGLTGAYKEKGYYPEIPEEIKKMDSIQEIQCISDKEELHSFKDYFVVSLDSNGHMYSSKVIKPLV